MLLLAFLGFASARNPLMHMSWQAFYWQESCDYDYARRHTSWLLKYVQQYDWSNRMFAIFAAGVVPD